MSRSHDGKKPHGTSWRMPARGDRMQLFDEHPMVQTTHPSFYDLMVSAQLHTNARSLQLGVESVFADTRLEGARVLDIGGGDGLHSYYAATHGAAQVICLEPELDGATSNTASRFSRLNETLNCHNVELVRQSFQDYQSTQPFDVLLLHNSINHLDEEACIQLKKSAEAEETYRTLFQKLFALAAPGATLIICDCTRYNVFGILGLRSPLVPTIEWHKHQTPGTWIRLLEEVGFEQPRVTWTSFNRLGLLGRVLLRNAAMSFFLNSHFCLRMRRPNR